MVYPPVAISGKFAIIYLQFLIFFSFYIEFSTEKEFNWYSVKFGAITTSIYATTFFSLQIKCLKSYAVHFLEEELHILLLCLQNTWVHANL